MSSPGWWMEGTWTRWKLPRHGVTDCGGAWYGCRRKMGSRTGSRLLSSDAATPKEDGFLQPQTDPLAATSRESSNQPGWLALGRPAACMSTKNDQRIRNHGCSGQHASSLQPNSVERPQRWRTVNGLRRHWALRSLGGGCYAPIGCGVCCMLIPRVGLERRLPFVWLLRRGSGASVAAET